MSRVRGSETAYVRPADGPCEAHDRPTLGLARWLIDTARARHPGGLNVCVDCIKRAREHARWISGFKVP